MFSKENQHKHEEALRTTLKNEYIPSMLLSSVHVKFLQACWHVVVKWTCTIVTSNSQPQSTTFVINLPHVVSGKRRNIFVIYVPLCGH